MAYTDKKQASRADLMRYAIREAGIPMLAESLILDIQFLMPIPKSIKAKAGDAHTKKPDIDNLLKMLFDCLQDLQLMKNDSNVWQVNARKCYAESAGIIFTVVDDPLALEAERIEDRIETSGEAECNRIAGLAGRLHGFSVARLHMLKAKKEVN